MVDFPALVDFLELSYMVEVPKPVDSFYQLLQPFTMNVWLIWVSILATFCFLCYLTAQSMDQSVISLSLLTMGLTIQPLTSTHLINTIRSKSVSGLFVIGSLVIGGNLVMTVLYRNVLLSHLTATEYEKPIETAQELTESNLILYTFSDKRLLDNLKNSATFQGVYQKVMDNGWTIDGTNTSLFIQAMLNGKEAGAMDITGYYNVVSKQIQKMNRKLFLMTKDQVYSYPRTIVLPKNGPITGTFAKFISRAFDTGLFHKILYQYQLRDGKCFWSKVTLLSLFLLIAFSRCH